MQKFLAHTAILLAVLTLGNACAAQPAPIHVNVNGTPVAFTGTPPIEVRGSVLVPLRGVFQAMGASVDYNAAARTITAHKGMATVSLPLGATTATVNGQTQTLSQPAQVVNGTTLVPLRFVAQALGAYVQWQAASSTVQIQTQEPHLSSLPKPVGRGQVVGQLTGVYPNTNPPQITIRVNGQDTVIPLSDSTIVLRSAPGQAATQVALSALNTGDQITVRRGSDGVAVSVTAAYGQVRGTIKSIGHLANGDATITLTEGVTVELIPNVPVTMAGRKVALSDVMPNEKVVIRTNPANNIGFGVAVITGGNPNPTPPGQSPTPSSHAQTDQNGNVAVAVTSFTEDAQGPLKAGDVLTATLTGTPGGQATFAIPGIVESVRMRETSPGVYTGAYTIPKNKSVNGAAVLGSLTTNQTTAPLIQAAHTVTIDSVPPHVVDFSPAKGATVESDLPLIYGTLSDSGGSGVNPDATHISLDGTDVTGRATITPAFFNLKPTDALSPGAHVVRVSLADQAGNTVISQWPFTVSTSRVVRAFTSNAASGQPIGAGTDLQFTLNAQPGGKASFSLGDLVKDIPMRETTPGVYVGNYAVARGDNIRDAPATARFVAPDGTTVTTTLKTPLTLAAGGLAAPRILSPDNNAAVGDTVTLTGTAPPNATVRLKIDYVSKVAGIFAVHGSAGGREVTADKNGNWTATDLPLQTNSLFGNGRDTSFTISAVTVGASGDESAPATLQVTRGNV